MENVEKVGIIIPAYNCEKYIDTCVDSVVNQTYKNLEIVIVLGQSTDGTDQKAYDWGSKDSRIKVMHQSCGRLGTARNEAISSINAEYIAFVDADDWLDVSFVDKMMTELKDHNRDMVICNRDNVIYGPDGLIEKYRHIKMVGMDDDAISVHDNPELIRSIEVSVNGKIYKKSLFTDNHILQPDVFGEDRAVIPYIICKCENIGRVKEVLYLYRAEHGANSVSNISTYFSARDCMDYILNEFSADELVKKYNIQLKSVFSSIAGVSKRYLSQAKGDDTNKAQAAERRIMEFVKENSIDPVGKRYTLGSYSLRRMAQYAFPQFTEKRESYIYSSIISYMSKGPLEIERADKFSNDQRKWYYYDIYKVFQKQFAPDTKDVLLIDFLEERYPVFAVDGMYFTYSSFVHNHEDIKSYFNKYGYELNEEERMELFEESCDKLISLLENRMDLSRVVLVKNFLSLTYGTIDNRKMFYENETIDLINNRLKKYYDCFESKSKEIKIVDNCKQDDHYFYTYENFEFDCRPWHYNDNFYMKQGTECHRLMCGNVIN